MLLVDDDMLVRESLADLLRELPLDVLAVESGDAALVLLARYPEIGVLVTDMMMPGMDGRGLAAQARRIRPDIQVLFLSGLDRPPDHELFLSKPVQAKHLLATVSRLVSPSGCPVAE